MVQDVNSSIEISSRPAEEEFKNVPFEVIRESIASLVESRSTITTGRNAETQIALGTRLSWLLQLYWEARASLSKLVERHVSLPQTPRLLVLPIAAIAGVVFLVWCTRRRSLLAQFLVLLAMGVSMSFLLLMIVQLPEYRSWLATLLVLMVFIASPVAVRIFLKSLANEENEQADEAHK